MASTTTEYQERRQRMIEYLGGRCTKCGEKKSLQFDHRDHLQKSFDISKNWSLSWETLRPELDKCQLLCEKHHEEKTAEEGSRAKGPNKQRRIKHGMVWQYSKHGCRCEPCREAKSVAMKRQRLRV